MTSTGDKIIDYIPGVPSVNVGTELVNFIHCQGTGYYLTDLPYVGLKSQGNQTSGYNLEVIDNSNGTHLFRKIYGSYEEVFATEVDGTLVLSMESQGNGISFHREPATTQYNVLLATTYDGEKYYLLASQDQSVSLVNEAYKTAKEQDQQSNPQAWKELLFNIISIDKSSVNIPTTFALSKTSNAITEDSVSKL